MYAILKKTPKSGKAVRKMSEHSFRTNVVTGTALLALSENVRGWQKRDCYRDLDKFIYGPADDRVCLLFGLRRTGKTTCSVRPCWI